LTCVDSLERTCWGDERARQERDFVEHVPIATQRRLVLGAAFDVFETEIGQPPACHRAQIVDAVRAVHVTA